VNAPRNMGVETGGCPHDAIFTHPTMLEGLIALFNNVPPASVPIFQEQLLHA